MAQMLRTSAGAASLIVLMLCAYPAAMAQDTGEIGATPGLNAELDNVRAVGMGGAFVGGGSGTGAIFYNPAGIVMSALYAFDAGYQRNQNGGLNSVGVSIVDAKTNPAVGAGVSYSFGFGEDDALADRLRAAGVEDFKARIRDHDIRAILAFPLVPRRVSLGIGMHFVNHRRGSWTSIVDNPSYDPAGAGAGGEVGDSGDAANPVPTGGSAPTTSADPSPGEPATIERRQELAYKGLTLDAGLMATAGESFSFGFAAQNLLSIRGYDVGRVLSGGAAVYLGDLHLEGAWFAEQELDGKAFEHGGAIGLEYVIDVVPVRLGFRQEGTERTYMTAGLGYRSTRGGGDFAFRQNVRDTDDRLISFSLSAYF